MNLQELRSTFQYWISEREKIRVKKEAGEMRPWTADPILDKYRFCNVRRENDKVTRWIRRNWSKPEHPNFILAMTIARLVNWPETLEELGFPYEWSEEHFIGTIDRRHFSGKKTWSSAYIVSTNGHATPKPIYVARAVLNPISARCAAGQWPTPLRGLYGALRGFQGVGSFIAGQIVADAKNTVDSSWWDAEDWYEFVVPGPGSKRGLARLLGKPAPYTLSDTLFMKHFDVAATAAREVAHLCRQDIQNCLCEFDKYMRVKLGEGTPRQHYMESE
jgi:hypothetical protein